VTVRQLVALTVRKCSGAMTLSCTIAASLRLKNIRATSIRGRNKGLMVSRRETKVRSEREKLNLRRPRMEGRMRATRRKKKEKKGKERRPGEGG